MKLLLSAYACEPHEGSEPGIGWNWAKQIARFHEVWVITRANNRPAIQHALFEEPMCNVHWVYFDLPRWARPWKKGQRAIRTYYYLWQIGVYFVGRRLHKEVRFDIVHHVTFGNYWLPSFLSLLRVPFVWGPVGGGEAVLKGFSKTFGLRGMLYEVIRDLARWVGEHDPFVLLSARRARVALATTVETGERLEQLGARQVKILSQVGLPAEEIRNLGHLAVRKANSFRLVSVGRLIHWKGFHLGLMAFADFQKSFPASEYWLMGEGTDRKRLERLAHKLGVAEKVRFWGAIPRAQVLDGLANCDVLVHPSLHEAGGWVCIEAMAARRPVICLDIGGPALQVAKDTGFKVPAITPDQAVGDLAQAMLELARDVALRARMGEAARRRVVEHFAWDRKCEWLNRIYQEVVFPKDMG